MVIEILDPNVDNPIYYIIPNEIGKILKKSFGKVINDPYRTMGKELYDCYMSFCLELGDIEVKQSDIVFHLY